MDAQFGPHRFYSAEGGGGTQFRGARFDVADLRGARFTDCDLSGVTIRDGWLVNVSISGCVSNVTVNGVDVTDFVGAELDRRHPERVQFREGQTADDVRAIWDTIERLWGEGNRTGRAAARGGAGRAGRRGMVVRADPAPPGLHHRRVGQPDGAGRADAVPSARPATELVSGDGAAALGLDPTAQPGYAEILAARAGRMAVMRRIVAGLTDEDLGRMCQRSPAPGYPEEGRTVIDCISVVLDEEIEHHRFAVRDLVVLESR